MKISYCFHTHTYRCGHAKGKDEDYVISALKNGINNIGFSDHVMLEDIHRPQDHADIKELPGYVSSITGLKEKYKGQANIYLGFEAEYAQKYLPYFKSLFKKYNFDYLILGQHFDFNDVNALYIKHFENDNEYTRKYADQTCEAMRTGLFLYLAHPDLYVISYTKWDKCCEEVAHQICKCAEENKIPLEINAHACMHWKKSDRLVYPYFKFWEIASKYDISVVLGYDAHDPEEFSEDVSFFNDLVQKYHLKLADISLELEKYQLRIKKVIG